MGAPKAVASAEATAAQKAGGQGRRGGEDQGQGTWPERRSQPLGGLGEFADAQLHRGAVSGDQRERHALRPPLGGEDPFDRRRAPRIRGQTVERLGRVDDELRGTQKVGGAADGDRRGLLRVYALDLCHEHDPRLVRGVQMTISDPAALDSGLRAGGPGR